MLYKNSHFSFLFKFFLVNTGKFKVEKFTQKNLQTSKKKKKFLTLATQLVERRINVCDADRIAIVSLILRVFYRKKRLNKKSLFIINQ